MAPTTWSQVVTSTRQYNAHEPLLRHLGIGQGFAGLVCACEHVRIQELVLGTSLTSVVIASDARRHAHQASYAGYMQRAGCRQSLNVYFSFAFAADWLASTMENNICCPCPCHGLAIMLLCPMNKLETCSAPGQPYLSVMNLLQCVYQLGCLKCRLILAMHGRCSLIQKKDTMSQAVLQISKHQPDNHDCTHSFLAETDEGICIELCHPSGSRWVSQSAVQDLKTRNNVSLSKQQFLYLRDSITAIFFCCLKLFCQRVPLICCGHQLIFSTPAQPHGDCHTCRQH